MAAIVRRLRGSPSGVTRMKVTAIVPSYNHARFLPQRLQAVFNQTHQDLDVVLLDDASSDGSWALLQAHAAHPRVTACVRRAQNSGSPFAQWNDGVRLATGDAVWIAESDDACAPDLVETLVNRLQQHPDVCVAFAHSWVMDEQGRLTDRLHRRFYPDMHPTRWREDFVCPGHVERARYLWQKNTIPNVSAALIRRAAFVRAGGADARMRMCADWDLWVRLLEHGDLAFCARPLNYFRDHAQTVRHRLARDVRLRETLTPILRILQSGVLDEPTTRRAKARIAQYWWWLGLTGRLTPQGHRAALQTMRAHDPAFARVLLKSAPRAVWRGVWHVARHFSR